MLPQALIRCLYKIELISIFIRIKFYYLVNSLAIEKNMPTKLPQSAAERPEGVAAVNRALAVLRAFNSAPEGMTLKLLASATGLYESTILRLLDSLMLAGYVKRLADGRYVVGPSVVPLAEMYRQSFKLSDYVLPRLRELTAQTHECSGLYVREGDRRICLHHVQPQRTVRTHVREGELFPLDRGAAGRVILAFDERLPGEPYDAIRKQGYWITMQERDPESAAIACPVFGQQGSLLGVISLVIPLYRYSDDVVRRVLPAVQSQARLLSMDLGGPD
ncbi:IclR family transcriptional regulator [Candidimonas nitroreducens]|nr:IclR family transcriptional regulator [Candidimonas nitroreducens]